eukprot:CAMPEP_0118832162 /NCGR_PEP_ID=MMETSP1162-20130426/36111_1 /TAXON_ID=33656 /ORGANISM="Phaeocystis Sp, Strain CCMP2710" /LENGTH=34 /DNA_ID= /DNA_START= /DNA_END= /DNA_ORIENTATION=
MTCPLRAACSCTAELTPLALARRGTERAMTTGNA